MHLYNIPPPLSQPWPLLVYRSRSIPSASPQAGERPHHSLVAKQYGQCQEWNVFRPVRCVLEAHLSFAVLGGVQRGCVSARGCEQGLLPTFDSIDANRALLTHQAHQRSHLTPLQKARTSDTLPLQKLFDGDPVTLVLYLPCMECNMTSLMIPFSAPFICLNKLSPISL